MRRNFVVLSVIFAMSCAVALGAENYSEIKPASVAPMFGYLDPTTNIFTPAPLAAKPAASEAATPIVRTGTLIVTMTVVFIPSFPAGGIVSANVNATTQPPAAAEPKYLTDFRGTGQITRTGATGLATITIPYAVTVSSATDPMLLDITLSASNGEYAAIKQTLPLPAEGATTRLSVYQRL